MHLGLNFDKNFITANSAILPGMTIGVTAEKMNAKSLVPYPLKRYDKISTYFNSMSKNK